MWTWRTTCLRLMAVDKTESERGNEAGTNQGSGWRLQTHLCQILEKIEKKIEREEEELRGTGVQCSQIFQGAVLHIKIKWSHCKII